MNDGGLGYNWRKPRLGCTRPQIHSTTWNLTLVTGLAGSCGVETGKSEVQGNPELHSEFESRLG